MLHSSGSRCYFRNLFTFHFFCSDSVGGSTVVGDKRLTGTFGVNVDLVAKSHCSVELIMTEDILVMSCFAIFFPPVQSQRKKLATKTENDIFLW